MIIPKYIKELMSRSSYEYNRFKNHENYAAGYTIKIAKYSKYQHIDTFNSEIQRLVKWANRQVADTAYILHIPKETHYEEQYAVVTIFDPIMKDIEEYLY